MILAVSSDAGPRASLAELAQGCARRGIQALHLVEGHAHGISVDDPATVSAELRSVLQASGVRITTSELRSSVSVTPEAAAMLSVALGCGIIARDATSEWTGAVERKGGRIARSIELNAAVTNVAEAIEALTDELPAHLVLRGGGPEAARYEGRGIGALMARLSLAAYRGTIVLAPTAKSVLPVWSAWLNQRLGVRQQTIRSITRATGMTWKQIPCSMFGLHHPRIASRPLCRRTKRSRPDRRST